MENKIIIPHIPFYFVRHGQTDWNKVNQELCDQDDISLNEAGLIQAANASNKINKLGITKIYSSPLMRAKQTAEIINKNLNVHLEFHEGLRQILPEKVSKAFVNILKSVDVSSAILIVSHGEVYRLLLRILNAQAIDLNPRNGGVYYFNINDSKQWIVQVID